MMAESSSDRFRVAQKIAAVKQNVAQAITDEFFVNHPEWTARYGERGRQHCTADACFHLEFLAGAMEAGSPEAFADYSRWTARMLSARGVAAHTLDENFVQLGKHLSLKLAPEERECALTFLARGRAACLQPEQGAGAPPAGDRLELTRKVFIAAI